nr:uncharacterized protein LOC109169324 [Ipomoea batatas]
MLEVHLMSGFNCGKKFSSHGGASFVQREKNSMVEKVEEGYILGLKTCDRNFIEASYGGAQAEVFNTLEASKRFQTWISTRDFKKERRLEFVVPERWNWGPLLLAQPDEAFASVAINTYYGTRNYDGEDYYHRELMPGRITVGTLNEISRSFHREAEWNERQTIDVGALINHNIREIASSDKKSRCPLSHPFFITELCRLAGVPIDPHQEVKYNMEQFFARQEKFMRRQEEFMTRHEGYMRRSDDVNWFVGTSVHQHNLAAQGLSP